MLFTCYNMRALYLLQSSLYLAFVQVIYADWTPDPTCDSIKFELRAAMNSALGMAHWGGKALREDPLAHPYTRDLAGRLLGQRTVDWTIATSMC